MRANGLRKAYRDTSALRPLTRGNTMRLRLLILCIALLPGVSAAPASLPDGPCTDVWPSPNIIACVDCILDPGCLLERPISDAWSR